VSDLDWVLPTDEDVAAIVCILVQEEQAERRPLKANVWVAASRAEATDRWPQPKDQSRPTWSISQ